MIYASILFGLIFLFPVICYGFWRYSAKYNSPLKRLLLRSLLLAFVFAPVPIFPLGIGEFFVPSTMALLFYGFQPPDLQEEDAFRAVSLMLCCILVTWAIFVGIGYISGAVRTFWKQVHR